MIFVKLHLSIWRVEDERGECITEFLLATGKIAIDLVECLKGSFRLVVIIHGAQGRAGEAIFEISFIRRLLIGFYKRLPFRVFPSVSEGACGVDAGECLFG